MPLTGTWLRFFSLSRVVSVVLAASTEKETPVTSTWSVLPAAPFQDRGQADSRTRPLARRLARMARPARVRIRTRNPWVLERRRLLGWKVFFTAHPHRRGVAR